MLATKQLVFQWFASLLARIDTTTVQCQNGKKSVSALRHVNRVFPKKSCQHIQPANHSTLMYLAQEWLGASWVRRRPSVGSGELQSYGRDLAPVWTFYHHHHDDYVLKYTEQKFHVYVKGEKRGLAYREAVAIGERSRDEERE